MHVAGCEGLSAPPPEVPGAVTRTSTSCSAEPSSTGTLTAILAALYTASIRLFTILFTDLTGVSYEAPIVFSTLVLAAAFTPVRRALEKAVEHRFKASAITAEGSGLPVGSISVADLREVVRGVVREELDRR